MRLTISALILLFISSCKPKTEHEKIYSTITGDWLIISKEFDGNTNRQKRVYDDIQDSIGGLTALKLVNFSKDGSFYQMDSLQKPGRWAVSPTGVVYISDAGKGFEDYEAKVIKYDDDILKFSETVQSKGQNIKIIWQLKRVSGSDASLLSPKRNEWRKKPAQPESANEMKARLSAMLLYYSDYCSFVTKETDYFVVPRVLIPFKYYQHAMGLAPFDENSAFVNLFYNTEQAKQAHDQISVAIKALRHDFPSGENFVEEYALFMKKIGTLIGAN